MSRVCLYCARYPGEPFLVPPLGIGYLASYLVESGTCRPDDVRIVDSLEEALDFSPEILGVGSVSQTLSDAVAVAAACKAATGCATVLGGYHITCQPKQLPEAFDVGVVGEGERAFADLVEALDGHQLIQDRITSIPGLVSRRADRVTCTEPRPMVENVDSLPWPVRHRNYGGNQAVFTSRGCPYRCTYCASHTFWGDTVRFRSADSVVSEIVHVVEAHRPKEIAILDDLWMADKRRFRQIVDGLVERGVPEQVTFRGFCRSNLIHAEDVLLLKKMNYRFLRFGAETGSERLLREIKGRNISIADHQRVIDLAADHGLRCGASFMFGVPGETRADLDLTVDFLRRNRGRLEIMGFYFFNPIPGTPLWMDLLAAGKIDDDFDLSLLQLDLSSHDFRWDTAPYFNEENVPLQELRVMVERIREEFFPKVAETRPRRTVRGIARGIARRLVAATGLGRS